MPVEGVADMTSHVSVPRRHSGPRLETAAPRLLVLGITPQALRLAAILEARFGPRLSVALLDPGHRAARAVLADAACFGRFLATERIGIVIDAMHPLTRASRRAAWPAARGAFAPLLALRRPPWPRDPRDRWIEVHDPQAAREAVRRHGRRVMLTVEPDDLPAFAGLEGCHFLVRMASPPAEFPLAGAGDVICARGPFRVEDEVDLLRRARIDLLVTRASGGRVAQAKIAAARRLRLPVVLIHRGDDGTPAAETPLAASDWVAGLLVPAVGGA